MALTQAQRRWMDAAPFLQEQDTLISELAAKYGSAGKAVHSPEFYPRLQAIARRTPGVADWLADMP